MYPESLAGTDISSHAEETLFEEFKQQLNEHFYVFHSVAWLGIRHRGAPPSDGESDFVVVHPSLGVLIIEVKGGRVGFDSQIGWYSIRADGVQVKIKNPVEQAKRNKYALKDKINSLPNWPGKIPTIGHAVAFPDGVVDLPDLGLEMPSEIVLLHQYLGNLDSWLRCCFKFWAGEQFVPPGSAGVSALCDLLRRSWTMRDPFIGEEIGPTAAVIRRYTEEQFRNLDLLASHSRAAIRGCAGSGKTMLAIEKARRLAHEGFRTLLTCYNRGLAEEIQRMVGTLPRLRVQTFHSLCREYAARTGRDQRSDWDEARKDFFDIVMPEALADVVTTGGDDLKFDAIVVDEGQDFANTWWLALEMLLADPDQGILYVFYDDNQLVYSRPQALPVADSPYPLTFNCRNTREIHESVARFYHSDLRIRCLGPDGRPVKVQRYGTWPNDLRATLAETLARLVDAEGVHTKDMVVLSCRGSNKPPLAGIQRSGGFWLVPNRPGQEGQVACTTIRLFKGLERPVVILIIGEEDCNENELLYVAVSRASSYLEVLIHESLPDDLAAKFMRLDLH